MGVKSRFGSRLTAKLQIPQTILAPNSFITLNFVKKIQPLITITLTTIQWGSDNRTCPDFEWSKVGWVLNGEKPFENWMSKNVRFSNVSGFRMVGFRILTVLKGVRYFEVWFSDRRCTIMSGGRNRSCQTVSLRS